MTMLDTKAPTRVSPRPRGENAGTARSRTSSTSLDLDACTIDVSRQVTEIEHVLRVGQDLIQCVEGLAILERWQFDEMLDSASRRRARLLVQEFTARGLPLLARR